MTSNVGSQHMQQDSAFGFVDPSQIEATKYDAIKHRMQEDLKREFKPEFLNRIDDIIMFKALDKTSLTTIIDILLQDLIDRVKAKNIDIHYNDAVKKFLVEKGFNPKMGARPLRRAIQEFFEDSLSETMLNEGVLANVSAKATISKKKDSAGKEKTEVSFSINKKRKLKISPIIKDKSKTLESLSPSS